MLHQDNIVEITSKEKTLSALYGSIESNPQSLSPTQLTDLLNHKSFSNLSEQENRLASEEANQFTQELYVPILSEQECYAKFSDLFHPTTTQKVKQNLVTFNENTMALLTGKGVNLPFSYVFPNEIEPTQLLESLHQGKNTIDFLKNCLPRTPAVEETIARLEDQHGQYAQTYQQTFDNNADLANNVIETTNEQTTRLVEQKALEADVDVSQPSQDDTGPSI